MSRHHALWVLVVLPLLVSPARAAEISGWRGDGSGRFPAAQPPKTWSKETNVLWKTELPARSFASPVLLEGRLFLLAEPSTVLCVDAQSGEIRWQRQTGYAEALGQEKAAEIERAHRKLKEERQAIDERIKAVQTADPEAKELAGLKEQQKAIEARRREYAEQFPEERQGGAGNAAATPICDGERLFVSFGTGIVAAFAPNGDRLWIKHLEAPKQGFGHSASPVLADGKLLVHYQDLIALDPGTGHEIWRAKLPPKHGTPAVARVAGEEILVTPSGALVRAADGGILREKLFQLSNNSPLVQEGVIYAHESGKIKALRLPKSLDKTAPVETLWETSATRDQRMSSAVLHEGLLYAGTRRGLMDVVDAQTGKMLYRKRLDLGELFARVCVAGDLVFFAGRDGKTLVLRPGREYDEVQINESERYSSNPVFAGPRMYLRTEKHLVCIGE